MIDLKVFLDDYEDNLEYFDIDVFEYEIMEIPYQIKTLDKYYDKLTANQQEKFMHLNYELIKLINRSKPTNKAQKDILKIVKESVEIEINKHLKVA